MGIQLPAKHVCTLYTYPILSRPLIWAQFTRQMMLRTSQIMLAFWLSHSTNQSFNQYILSLGLMRGVNGLSGETTYTEQFVFIAWQTIPALVHVLRAGA